MSTQNSSQTSDQDGCRQNFCAGGSCSQSEGTKPNATALETVCQLRSPNAQTWLASEVRTFDPKCSIKEGWLPPKSWYTTPEFYRLERHTVFKNNWVVAAREDQLRQGGDYVTGTIAGEPYVVVRTDKGQLKAFYNVCRHHAAEVALGSGKASEFQCPYHGWTYALDGRLAGAPGLGQIKSFDRTFMSLVPINVCEWGGLVFLCQGDSPRDLAQDLLGLHRELESMNFRSLNFVERRSYEIECNWKVFVDNYLDGGYHVPFLHKGLSAQLDLASYQTEIFDRFSIQSTGGIAATAKSQTVPLQPGEDFAERVGAKALYAYIYPNLMINRYGNMMDTNIVLPLGHERTLVHMDYYFLDLSGPGAGEFIASSLAASDTVQKEDILISESVQRGLGSTSYSRGRYSSKFEGAELHFHRLLAEDFKRLV